LDLYPFAYGSLCNMAHVQHCLDVIVGLMRCDQQKPSLTLACGMARCVGVMMGRGLQGWGMGGWWPPGAWTPPACRLQIPATLAGLTGATRSVHIQTGCCAVLCCAVLCCAVLCCAIFPCPWSLLTIAALTPVKRHLWHQSAAGRSTKGCCKCPYNRAQG